MTKQQATTTSFRSEHSKLKRGIRVAWFVNFLILTLTIEAAFLLATMDTHASNNEIVSQVLIGFAISVPVAVISTWLVSRFSWKAVQMSTGKAYVEQEPGTELHNIVTEMVVASGASHKDMPQVFVVESKDMNAFALSTPHGSQIVFTTALVEKLTRSELQAVAGHEWGHVMSGDSLAMTKLIAITSIAGFVSGVFTRTFFGGRGGDNNGKANPLAIAILVLSFAFLIFAPLMSRLANAFMSRQRETQADILSVQYTRNPKALASALGKISGTPHDDDKLSKVGQLAIFGRDGFSTHPPIDQRIDRLQRMGA